MVSTPHAVLLATACHLCTPLPNEMTIVCKINHGMPQSPVAIRNTSFFLEKEKYLLVG